MDIDRWRIEPLTAADYREASTATQSLLQSALWGALKSTVGWEDRYLMVSHPHYPSFPLLTLTKRLPLGTSLVYIAHAPPVPDTISPDRYPMLLSSLSAAVAAQLGRTPRRGNRSPQRHLGRTPRRGSQPPFMIRWDPPFIGDARAALPATRRRSSRGDRNAPTGRAVRLIPAPHSVQPRHTIIIDLRPDAEHILAHMKAKTRYNIHLAERKEVTVNIAIAAPPTADGTTPITAELRRWYAVYRQTCARNRIGQRPLQYFQTLFRLSGAESSDVRVELLCAEHAEVLLGGIIVAYHNGTATYLFGASASIMRNLMANHLLQWQAILRAKQRGCSRYDLFGVAPAAHGHYLSGLYRFKTGFGGRLIERWGSVDHILAPIRARLYRSAERARFFYYRRINTRSR